MNTYRKLASTLLLSCVLPLWAHAMEHELNRPSIALPAETPQELRAQLLAALNDPECKFLSGRFINSSTTLEYGGATPSLNRLITRLAESDGVEVVVSFTKAEPNGPTWIVRHSGGRRSIGVQVNIAASALDLDQLAITVVGAPKKPGAKSG